MSNPSMHVLLIEDNPGDADLIRLRLVEGNPALDVACADRLASGLDALDHEQPALVLLDLNLPDSRGAETFRKVLKKAPGVPIVVLSGQDDEELALKAVHQGVQDYLVKGGFDSKQLARAMRYAMERQAMITALDMSRKQQLQFKDQFLSHVSHELRTPLTSIHQFTTILLDGLAGAVSPEQRDHLETVMRSVSQLQSMIGQLLEAARAETGKIRIEPGCIEIDSAIRQAFGMMQASADSKQIGLELGVDRRIPLVLADHARVIQILTNLLDNAIKFTPAGGSVMVKAFLVEADPSSVYVSVADTGQGIRPEAKALIFERMYQDPDAVDNSRKGLGLGLYIVHELVRLHGGRIWVESQPGHGSTFTFNLPLFSLAKLLSPVITEQGRLREALTLVSVELLPRDPADMGNWDLMSAQVANVLRSCVLPAKDLLLPAMPSPGKKEIFLIVASTDDQGAEVLSRRIREQLERLPGLRGRGSCKISKTPIPIPSSEETIEEMVQEIADSTTTLAMQTLHRTNREGGNGLARTLRRPT